MSQSSRIAARESWRATSLRGVLVLLPSDQGRSLAFHDCTIDHDVGYIFPARDLIHDVEHDLFEHRTQSARTSAFRNRLVRQERAKHHGSRRD